MTVELAGFERQQLQIRLEVNQRVRADVVLRTGVLSQQVEVVQTMPLLHVSDAVVGEVIDQRQVAELPLNGRQFLELALLVPGAHTSHGAQMGDMSPLYWRPGQNSAITIAGGRPNSNVYLLDGTVNTERASNTFVISLPRRDPEFQIRPGPTPRSGGGNGEIMSSPAPGRFKVRGSLLRVRRNSRSIRRSSPTPTSSRRSRSTSSAHAGRTEAAVLLLRRYEAATTQHMSQIMFGRARPAARRIQRRTPQF